MEPSVQRARPTTNWVELESISWNRFGRNSRTKPHLVQFRFPIMTLRGFKIPYYPRLLQEYTQINYLLFWDGKWSKIWGWKLIRKVFGRNGVE
jgi:hypothetical protein